MKKSNKKKDIKIIKLYISELRKLGIKSGIRVFYNSHSFIIYLEDKKEYLEFVDEVNNKFLKIDKKYLKHLSKYIIFDCLYNFYADDEVMNYHLSSGHVKNITGLFPNATKIEGMVKIVCVVDTKINITAEYKKKLAKNYGINISMEEGFIATWSALSYKDLNTYAGFFPPITSSNKVGDGYLGLYSNNTMPFGKIQNFNTASIIKEDNYGNNNFVYDEPNENYEYENHQIKFSATT